MLDFSKIYLVLGSFALTLAKNTAYEKLIAQSLGIF